MEKYITEGKVSVHTSSPVTKVHGGKAGITGISCDKDTYYATSYLFSTGSVSHKETGSTGDGFKWLKELGHTVLKPTPTIVPIAVKDTWSKKLAGISVSAKITFFVEGKKAFSETG